MTPLNVLKKIFTGMAGADAGEFLTPRQKAVYLENIQHNTVKTPEPILVDEVAPKTRGRHRVAMYMGSQLPATMMDYVVDTCESLDHDLTVVTFESGAVTDTLLAPYRERLDGKGISMELARLTGEPVKGLARFLRSHPEIAFMACKESGYLGRSYMNGKLAKNALPVPIVVVVDSATSTQADQTQTQTNQVNAA